jgi:hypothetical protein
MDICFDICSAILSKCDTKTKLQLMQVNKTFLKAGNDPWQWTSLDLGDVGMVEAEKIAKISNCVQRISFVNVHPDNFAYLLSYVHFPNLKEVVVKFSESTRIPMCIGRILSRYDLKKLSVYSPWRFPWTSFELSNDVEEFRYVDDLENAMVVTIALPIMNSLRSMTISCDTIDMPNVFMPNISRLKLYGYVDYQTLVLRDAMLEELTLTVSSNDEVDGAFATIETCSSVEKLTLYVDRHVSVVDPIPKCKSVRFEVAESQILTVEYLAVQNVTIELSPTYFTLEKTNTPVVVIKNVPLRCVGDLARSITMEDGIFLDIQNVYQPT